ncbi:hypothetical protein [Variovorax sp. J22R115]|uniref:hypothetical protein n=1 Tax=Variovorax sp. J22R115 TaxID=3053509 RepID=UPI002575652C|nr:hypothetical protein [Variovorax sp. J22R115]MDM0050921.1 hypothetical protein [Variovorax sp. J22R115]
MDPDLSGYLIARAFARGQRWTRTGIGGPRVRSMRKVLALRRLAVLEFRSEDGEEVAAQFVRAIRGEASVTRRQARNTYGQALGTRLPWAREIEAFVDGVRHEMRQ